MNILPHSGFLQKPSKTNGKSQADLSALTIPYQTTILQLWQASSLSQTNGKSHTNLIAFTILYKSIIMFVGLYFFSKTMQSRW